ncbi:MAG: phospho-N-acetylmuramoyl-pentapeptide-transferase [Cytophagales bacterium]|nr:phospho-N-acetylmuramoyl-pentapeptide-transferase [Cytophagales bacterium]
MLYHLFHYLEQTFNLPGASVFEYISFRAGTAAVLSLLIGLFFGGKIIRLLKSWHCIEKIRTLGLEGQEEKKGTPTMGGLLILSSILIPTMLLARLDNIYILLLIFTALWMGGIGFIDDYIKLKKGKEGLNPRLKIIGQVVCGLIAGLILIFHEDVVIRNLMPSEENISLWEHLDIKELITTIPFVKDNELNYMKVFSFLGEYYWIGYLGLVVFIVSAVSNGANIVDGLDGLAAGSSAIIGLTLAIFAYLSGNIIFSDYLNIIHIPDLGEIVIFCAAFVGACIGFLWYNSYPAQIFMGDTGSMLLGGLIAIVSLIVRKELLIPVFCGIFLVENLSVLLQVGYFKYSRWKTGTGKRLLLMAPWHHHFQQKGVHESKIVLRFWAIGILLAVLSLVTLKVR